MLSILDLSSWEDDPKTAATVDFNVAKLHGIVGAYFRATIGLSVDTAYKLFRQNCAPIMPFGVYAYVYPESIAPINRQAEKFISVTKDNPGQLPICFDWEEENVTWNMAYQWISLVRAAFPANEIIIYSRTEFLLRHLPDSAKQATSRAWFYQFPIWDAYYSTKPPTLPGGWSDWLFWQYTSHGDAKQYGIADAKNVDISYFNGTIGEYTKRFHLEDIVIPPEPLTNEQRIEILEKEVDAIKKRLGL